MRATFAALMLFAAGAMAGTTSDRSRIDAVVRTFPMTDASMGYKTLAERLDNLHLALLSMESGPFSADDLQMDKSLRRGDVGYVFRFSEPSEMLQAICPVTATATFIRRGSGWLPTDRTANFLMNYRCVAPD